MRYVTVSFDNIELTTERAVCLTIEGQQIWVPRSQLEDPDSLEVSFGPGECEVKEWFAEKEGLV